MADGWIPTDVNVRFCANIQAELICSNQTVVSRMFYLKTLTLAQPRLLGKDGKRVSLIMQRSRMAVWTTEIVWGHVL